MGIVGLGKVVKPATAWGESSGADLADGSHQQDDGAYIRWTLTSTELNLCTDGRTRRWWDTVGDGFSIFRLRAAIFEWTPASTDSITFLSTDAVQISIAGSQVVGTMPASNLSSSGVYGFSTLATPYTPAVSGDFRITITPDVVFGSNAEGVLHLWVLALD